MRSGHVRQRGEASSRVVVDDRAWRDGGQQRRNRSCAEPVQVLLDGDVHVRRLAFDGKLGYPSQQRSSAIGVVVWSAIRRKLGLTQAWDPIGNGVAEEHVLDCGQVPSPGGVAESAEAFAGTGRDVVPAPVVAQPRL